MKQIKTNDGFKHLKESILKKKSYSLAAAAVAVLAVATTMFFMLMKETKSVIEPAPETITTGNSCATGTSQTAAQTTAAAPSSTAVTAATTTAVQLKNEQANKFINSITDQVISIIYPDSSTGMNANAVVNMFEHNDFKAILKEILDMLPSSPSTEQRYGPGKLISISLGSPNRNLSIYKPENGSKTIVRIGISQKIRSTDFWYVCDSSVYDTAADLIKPYITEDATKTALTFIKGLSERNTGILNNFLSQEIISSWPIFAMTNVTYAPIAVDKDKAVYTVSFDLDNNHCSAFQQGHNERVLVVDSSYGHSCFKAFVDSQYYAEPQTDADKLCLQFAKSSYGKIFSDVSKISASKILDFILDYKKGTIKLAYEETLKEEYPSSTYGFSRKDMAQYVKKLFGIDAFDATNTDYYYINGDYYYNPQSGDSHFNSAKASYSYRFVRSECDDSGNYTVTIAEFKDYIQSDFNSLIRFELNQNADGTYHFVSAACAD